MFIDSAKIYVRAGNGGNGMVSFHTAKYVPNGGPDGGSGGRVAVSSSMPMKTRRRCRISVSSANMQQKMARKWPAQHVRPCWRRFASAVPVGTIIKDAETGRILADFTEADQTAVIARGGRGGAGNALFATVSARRPISPGQ
jgi:GTP-binding protein